MRNLHKFILENYGIGLLKLLRDWEKFQFRQCNFKNHRIFTLRCIHSELIPVSIRLKSTLKSERAKEILRMAEKLLQSRLKSINSLLDKNAKQLEPTRSKIASILTPLNYQECQDFIDKTKEKRFIKVRERQVRKLNNLINKKEGGITWQTSQATRAFPWANNRQAVPRLPWQIALWQAVHSPRQAVPRLPQQIVLWQAVHSPRKAVPRQAVPRLPQKISLFHLQRVHSPSQAIPRLPWKKTLSHQQRVSSPRAVSPLPQRIVLSRQRVLYLLRQSGAWQGLRLGSQATPLWRSVRSLSKTVLFPRGYFPRTMLPKRQGPSPVGTTPHRFLPPWRNLTQSG